MRSAYLDHFRFALAIYILLVHTFPWASAAGDHVPAIFLWFTRVSGSFFQPLGETNPAVLAFIVLSGYCIHKSGVQSGLRAYATRRIFRIVPIFLLAIAVGAIAYEYSASVQRDVTERITGTTGISGWMLLARATGLPVVMPPLHLPAFLGNAPLGTVMVEIWLYACYPLLLLGLRNTKHRWLVLVAIWAGGTILCRLMPTWQPWWHNGSLPGFLLYWWIGAAFVQSGISRKQLALTALAFVAMSVVLLTVWPEPLLAELRKVALALLIGVCIRTLDHLKPSQHREFWFGQAGYSIYAFHAPVVYTTLVLGAAWWMSVSVALAVGGLVFLSVERPLTNKGRQLSQHWKKSP